MSLELEKHLVLNHYFLNLFGYKRFNELREDFSEINVGYGPSGNSYFVDVLMGINKHVSESDLLQYDSSIKGYETKLKKNRTEPFLNLKYFQYFALLFTEIYLDKLKTDKEVFIKELNDFSQTYCQKNKIDTLFFTEDDLKKLAFWMATGSGKTLLMHINYWQILKYFPDWENIILITPNEGLSKQHYDEYVKSGIPVKQYTGSEESLKTEAGEVLVIEITKLTEEKKGEGKSVDISYFSENNNLVFIDEGHKGQKSEEQTWKKLREKVASKGFLFEYSATFGQVISQQKGMLLDEYSKSIIFDYSYKYFYSDGYGKDFYTYNIKDNNYSEAQTELLLTAGLLSYYEQLITYRNNTALSKEYKIEEPLWIFVGSKVSAKSYDSDIVTIVNYLNGVVSKPSKLDKQIKTLLGGRSKLIGATGNDIFKDKFIYLKDNVPSAEEILKKVFNGTGSLELYEIKNAEGEIGLKMSGAGSNEYFGVINIGGISELKKKMEEDGIDLELKPDNISNSLFDTIDTHNSPVKILIGAKKFIEGWNSWRVSNMGLMNMGKSEGAQIIQLFGRGVRLKGKELSLKREEPAAPALKTLQTLSIFGLNADYISAFLEKIEDEVPIPTEIPIEIKFNREDEWKDKIFTFNKDEGYNFKDELVKLEYREKIAKRVSIDLRAKVTATAGFVTDTGQADDDSVINPLQIEKYSKLISWNEMVLTMNDYKVERNFYNLAFDRQTLQEIISKDAYKVLIDESQLPDGFIVKNKIQNIAELVLKDYISKYYTDNEKDHTTKHLKIELLNPENHKDLFPKDNKIILKVPKEFVDEVKELVEDINQFYNSDVSRIPTIHFDKHLYSPITAYKKGTDYESIKTFPVKLNEGETKFIDQMRTYLNAHLKDIKDKEIFILRNISKKGIGFFLESTSFYPDFIIWIKSKDKQEIIFVDPKGILMLGNLNDEKIRFCNEIVPEIEAELKEKLIAEKNKTELSVHAYILSVTEYLKVKPIFGDKEMTKEEFNKENILFLEDGNYLEEIFKNV